MAGFQNEAMQIDLGKSWRQLARWLVADVPNRIAAEAIVKPEDGQDAVRLQVRVADKKFTSGFYVNVIFEGNPSTVAQLRSRLSLNADIFRVIVTSAAEVKDVKK